ncbi:nucleoside-diphosphate sugar epimerases (plasmid) [Legionella adelaidensis]|uniref:Nucleoside-diphosphate sugar epimerases n=1 Tax=Legionella adelaidensis TaxID=45056 RepID=A0A0W0R4R6_9GAMM|nr:nucleoside-diphosphate sugar epimerase/dehydratase [Legionella adelaidensis]KTC66070.1 putative nucleoside-diphosphate sugar epimerase [Legionella adelaidensis]VEH85712.1 nucleoside-diphosphate sugar epimerases [Legionella adelaidensis]
MEKLHIFGKKLYSKFPIILYDTLCIPLAWYLAYWLRFNMQVVPENFTTPPTLYAFFCLFLFQLYSYYYFKVYRGLWRFSSLNDVIRIIRAVIVATLAIIPTLYMLSLITGIPRSVLPLYTINLITLLCGARLLYRLYWDRNQNNAIATLPQKVLIVGAGQAGEGLVRELKRTKNYIPMGIVDDDKKKKGLEVHGVRVLGRIKELETLVVKHKIDLIFIAIPSAGSALMRRIVGYCENANLPFRTLPSIQQLIAGKVQVNALRNVNIEDLLGRDQVNLSWDKIAENVREKVILITGGGGSIGSELCRQVMALSPRTLIVVDNNEYNLYKIEIELKEKYPNSKVILSLLNVTDSVAVNHLLNKYRPELVFHAAAYKHVPLLEDQIRIAVQNNVLGTQILAEASIKYSVKKFILISTDKAVNPTNVMGTTKRAAEIYCQNLNSRSATRFITVRFGNVLGSVGSVVPLFKSQLEKGGPLTVTHPDIQRYFMTIPEASQLILQAMANGEGGEIFVLDMGEPIKIKYLAEQIIRLAGKEPGVDILIEYTGLRPGEKLYEELFHNSEQLIQTEHEKLFKAQFRKMDWEELIQTLHLIQTACAKNYTEELLILLKSLVPEFKNQEHLQSPSTV